MTTQKLQALEEDRLAPYRLQETQELQDIVTHAYDHDCRCSDRDDYCSFCWYADKALKERGIDMGHFI